MLIAGESLLRLVLFGPDEKVGGYRTERRAGALDDFYGLIRLRRHQAMIRLFSFFFVGCFEVVAGSPDGGVPSLASFPPPRTIGPYSVSPFSIMVVQNCRKSNRGDRIRTCGLLLPKQAL